MLTREQTRHKVINLAKTVKLLERSANEDLARPTIDERYDRWLRGQAVLTGVKHCRAELQNMSASDYDHAFGERRTRSWEQFTHSTNESLDRLERTMLEVDEVLKLHQRLRELILPTLPKPSHSAKTADAGPSRQGSSNATEDATTLIPADGSAPESQISPRDLLLDPSEPEYFPDSDAPKASSSLLPPFSSSDRAQSAKAPASMETSSALQTEMAEQLVQMARQLKINSLHFSSTLANDQGVVKDVEEKLDRNYDDLKKERTKLRDLRGTTRSTTWLVIMSIVVVLIGFIMTYLVIRVT